MDVNSFIYSMSLSYLSLQDINFQEEEKSVSKHDKLVAKKGIDSVAAEQVAPKTIDELKKSVEDAKKRVEDAAEEHRIAAAAAEVA